MKLVKFSTQVDEKVLRELRAKEGPAQEEHLGTVFWTLRSD